MRLKYRQHQFEAFSDIHPDVEPEPVLSEQEQMYLAVSDTYINYLVTHPDYEEGNENHYYGDIFEATVAWWEDENDCVLTSAETADLRRMIMQDCGLIDNIDTRDKAMSQTVVDQAFLAETPIEGDSL